MADRQQIRDMSDRLSKWIASYRKQSASRSFENSFDDGIGKLITPDKVVHFDSSKLTLEVVKCLGEMIQQQQRDIFLNDYVTTRDFLLT